MQATPVILSTQYSPEDIQGVVRVHRTELNQGFLSSLGDGALSVLFQHAATSRYSVLLVAKRPENAQVIGFLLGTTDTGGFYKDFLRHRALKALVVVGPKLFSLKRIFKVVETLFYPSRKSVQDLPPAELLDIAVTKGAQGTGLGRLLFQEFCGILRERGIPRFRVTTGEALTQAHRFYERLGAKRVSTIEVHKGQKTFVYIYEIT